MFLRLFLTLLLFTGLTIDFEKLSLDFGTAAYAYDDDDDEYDDDDGDDDDDDGYFDGWDLNDFVNYIESGEAEDDGIGGYVWTDPDDFINNADPGVVEDAFEALEILESEGCCESSDGGNSESTQTSPEQGKQESGTENNGEKLIEDAIKQANELAQQEGFNKGDLTSYEIVTTQTENGVEVHLEAHYENTSAMANNNGDEVGHIDFSHNEFNVSIPISDDSNSSNGGSTVDDGNYGFGGHGEGDASGVASYGDSGYGDEGGNGYGDGGDGLIYPGEEVADEGYGGNDNGGFPDDGGDSGSIENIPADDEGGYEPTDNTPSTTEPEPTPQEQPEYKEPEKDSDCSEESIQMSQQVSDLYNQELFADSFNELKEATKTDSEKIFSIGRDYAGNLSVGEMHSGDGRTSYSSDIPNMVATAHSHPQGDLSCFSVSDLYSLASENMVDSRFSTIFVVGERATYAMQVTDAAKLRDFIDAHPRSEFVDPNTGGFTSVSDENGINLANEMYQDFRILLDIEHVSREDAFAHALSMLLSSQDVGVSMLKAETGENGETEFKEIKTKEVYDSETNEFKLKASECQ